MRITCPNCGTVGRLKKPPQAAVRCPKCEERWDPRTSPAEANAAEEAPARTRTEPTEGAGKKQRAVTSPQKRRHRSEEPREGDTGREKKSRAGRGDRDESGSARPAHRRRRGHRGRSGSASEEREAHGRRGGRRRRSRATLPLIAGGVALVLLGAIGGTVWFLQRRDAGGGDAELRARAEGYLRALRAADADAMFSYLHPDDVDRVRQSQGQTGVDLLKKLLGRTANAFQAAEKVGGKVDLSVSKATVNGDEGTVELTTILQHEDKAESLTNSMAWVRRDGKWYLSRPTQLSQNLAKPAAQVPPAEDDTAPDGDDTAPDKRPATEDPTAPDKEPEDDADVDITAPD